MGLAKRGPAGAATVAATVVYQAVKERLLILKDVMTSAEDPAPRTALEPSDDRSLDYYQEHVAK